MPDDRELRAAFQAQRAAERERAPGYSRVIAGRGMARRRPRGLLLAGALAVLTLVAVLLLVPSRAARELAAARRVMAWESPTAFLLPASTPPLLDSLPRFGYSVPGSALRALDPGGPLGPSLTRSPGS